MTVRQPEGRPLVAERKRRCQAFFLARLAEVGQTRRALAELDRLRETDRERFLRLTCGRDLSLETLRAYCDDTPAELVRWAQAAFDACRKGHAAPPLPTRAPAQS